MCKSHKEAEECYNICTSFLEDELKLNVHSIEESDKTNIVEPSKERFRFLSIENYEKLKNKLRAICNSDLDKTDVLSLLTKTRNATDGWISSFFYTDMDRYIEDLDYYVSRQVFLALRKFGWRFSSTSIGKLPHKYRQKGESADCLSKLQRIKSGIPLCKKMLDDKRKNEIKEIKEITPPNKWTLSGL